MRSGNRSEADVGSERPAWGLAWFVTTFVITRNVKEHFAVFGASGALVFALLTWLVLTFLFRPHEREARGYLNIDRMNLAERPDELSATNTNAAESAQIRFCISQT